MTGKQDLGLSLQKLAQAIVDRSLEEDVTLEERIEILKVVGAFHLGAKKIQLKLGDDLEGTPTFQGFKDLINGVDSRADG